MDARGVIAYVDTYPTPMKSLEDCDSIIAMKVIELMKLKV
jgi:hypothetical protein